MKKQLSICLCLFFILLVGCSSDPTESEVTSSPVISGLEDTYSLHLGGDVTLSPKVTNDKGISYSWILNGQEVSKDSEYTFKGVKSGTYSLLFKVSTAGGDAEKQVQIVVIGEFVALETYTYTILPLELPNLKDNGPEKTEWNVITTPTDLYRISTPTIGIASFIAAREGEFHLQAVIGGVVRDIIVTVKKQVKTMSPYIAIVFDYLPAPGQFVNKLPEYEEGDTHEDMVRKAGEWLIGEDAYMITLGGWGGYVTIGFDHTIVNVPGKCDFRINGNAFGAASNGRPDAPFGGSCEPGVVMVAYDKNKNGEPDDDEWYEIKGSSNFTAETEKWYDIAVENKNDIRVFRNYTMTYYKPTKENPETDAEPDNPLAFETIKDYIRWEDNQNNSGYKVKNVYHTQTYYPAWVKSDKLTFQGIRLPENAINEGKYVPGINEGNVYFVLYGFRYGYVDNYPNVEDGSAIDIDWAIDKEGNKVDLPGIDFVKIYNGVNQENGWLGECSTEVERGEDLHMLGKRISTVQE